MAILRFLQQNAEWMCAIAIVGFTAVQCWFAYQQNMQNIRMNRLELTSKFDKVTAQFLSEIEEAKLVRTWLVSNASNFTMLLNNKDLVIYKELTILIYNYLNIETISSVQKLVTINNFINLVSKLDAALIDAKYGKEFESINKGTGKCE